MSNPAFPHTLTINEGNRDPVVGDTVPPGVTRVHTFSGIDVRTYIATAALQGLLASGCLAAAQRAVAQADALLRELDRTSHEKSTN